MQNDTAHIENLLENHLNRHSCWKAMAHENPSGFAVLRDALLAPGKRIRPLLFAAICRDLGMEPFPRLSEVALALELAHGFILIHDDLIDRSATRRGLPTLERAADQWFQEAPADGFRGRDFALVGGDLLFALSVDCLLKADVSESCRQQMVGSFLQAAQQTARGAFLEMQAAQIPVVELRLDQIENIYALKTGSYTFSLPLKLAGLCAGRPVPDSDRIGRAAGIAFQLQNDLKSLQRWMETGEMPDDVRDQRRTWPLVYAGSREMLCSEKTLKTLHSAASGYAEQALETIQGVPLTGHLLKRIFDAAGSGGPYKKPR